VKVTARIHAHIHIPITERKETTEREIEQEEKWETGRRIKLCERVRDKEKIQ
jgi:hypothetical protein